MSTTRRIDRVVDGMMIFLLKLELVRTTGAVSGRRLRLEQTSAFNAVICSRCRSI
jgi:hypothetical protein